MLNFVGLARVSSREQEREGFSLDVQEEALRRHAERQGGEIVKLFRIAETASKTDERKTFKELLAYAREHAADLAGVLFYKVDRAARNLFDYVELERLESDCGLPVVYVAQATENTPAGRMQRRILANMAAFYTEQQSLDVKEGMARRVQGGLFPGKAPFGYRNVRVDGRSLVEVHPEQAAKVRRIFQLYAYDNHTLDSLGERLLVEGIYWAASRPRWCRTKLHEILTDRCYVGEVCYRGQWVPGKQERLIDAATWERVSALLGAKVYRSHGMLYAGNLIKCGCCGHPITGEVKSRKTRSGETEYTYYRCTRYNAEGHPRVRLREEELDAQVLALFDRMKIQDEKIRGWFLRVLQERARFAQGESKADRGRLHQEIEKLCVQRDRLLNLRLMEEIDADTFAAKKAELETSIRRLRLQTEVTDRGQAEYGDIAVKAFELSQALREKWVAADSAAKRHLLEIICLNFSLDGTTLTPTMRKPFDVLAEGLLLQDGRGGRI